MLNRRGFSLVELLIAMAVGLVVLGVAFSIFTVQNKSLNNQEQLVELQQSVRAAMDMMSREVRMAGYNPARATFDAVTFDTSQLEVRADLDGSAGINGDEDIIYAYDSVNKIITRNAGSGAEPLAENIDAFTFQYLDSAGNPAATSTAVTMVRITITGRTAQPDPDYSANSGYRTYTLTSDVTRRN